MLTVLGLIPLVGAVVVALLGVGGGSRSEVPPTGDARTTPRSDGDSVGAVAVGAGAADPADTSRDRLARQVALAFSLVTLAFAIYISAAFVQSRGGSFQFVQTHNWIRSFGVHYGVGVDGIALVLIALTAVLTPVVILASWHDAEPGQRSDARFFALVLALETLLFGVFAATDIFLFYVFFEAMLIPMYFLIGRYGGPQRSYAAMKFLLYSLFGGLLMLAAVIGVYVVAASHGHPTLDYRALVGNLGASSATEKWLFLGFFIAFAIKAPLWPFHTWLPDAGAEAPFGASVLIVGVLDKVGTFGFLRYCFELFPHASRWFAPYAVVLSVIGIIYGSLVAIGQRDLKRLVSYTSVAHFGFIALGCFAMTSQGMSGAVLYMVNHGLSTGALFLLLGFLIHRGRSRLIGEYGGVVRVAPMLAGTFLIAGLSSLALPGLSSFVSEFMVLIGSFPRYRVAAAIATVGIILAALYILIMYQRTMQGPRSDRVIGFRDLSRREIAVITPVLALIVFLGFYPKPLLDSINPAVARTMHNVQRTDPRPAATAGGAGTGAAAAAPSTGVAK